MFTSAPRPNVLSCLCLIFTIVIVSMALQTPEPIHRPRVKTLVESDIDLGLKQSVLNQDLEALVNEKIEYYQAKIKADPFNYMAFEGLAAAYLQRMRVLSDENDLLLTRKAVDKAKSLRPKNSANPLLEISLLSAQHKFKQSLKLLDDYAGKDKTPARLVRVDLQIALGRYRAAEITLSSVEQRKRGEAWLLRSAHLSLLRGHFAISRASYSTVRDQMIHWRPQTMPWLEVMIGVTHLNAGEIPEAQSYFQSALKLAPKYYLALEHLAETYEINGESKKAKLWLEKAIAVSRKPELLIRLSALESEIGSKELAVQLRNEAVQSLIASLAAKDFGHIRELAQFYLDREEKLDEALRLAKMDLEIRQDCQAWVVLACAHRKLNQLDAAEAALKNAEQSGVRNTALFEERYALSIIKNDKSRATRAKSELKKINPLAATELE